MSDEIHRRCIEVASQLSPLLAEAIERGGPLTLCADDGQPLTGPVLRISVRDWSDRSPQVRPFDPHASRGRGLQLVGNLAQRWGCVHHDRGKTVWAELGI